MDSQLDISTAPGWLKKMWGRRQGHTIPAPLFLGLAIAVQHNGKFIGWAATEQAAHEMLAAYRGGQ